VTEAKDQPPGRKSEDDSEQGFKWQHYRAGVRDRQGHFIGINREGGIVEGHFVDVGPSEGPRHDGLDEAAPKPPDDPKVPH
jgi:hypothetical protein